MGSMDAQWNTYFSIVIIVVASSLSLCIEYLGMSIDDIKEEWLILISKLINYCILNNTFMIIGYTSSKICIQILTLGLANMFIYFADSMISKFIDGDNNTWLNVILVVARIVLIILAVKTLIYCSNFVIDPGTSE